MTATTLDAGVRREYEAIGVIGFAHGTSHFFHLLLPPLFPWLMKDFSLSFTEAGALMTMFFVVSGVGQALAGFVVDRIGARRVLLAGMALFALAGLSLGVASGYAFLMLAAALAGLGNSVFHPADFTVLNRRVSPPRLGHAFSVHGLSGNLGWALAPMSLTTIAAAFHWRTAALATAGVAACAFLVVFLWRGATEDLPVHAARSAAEPAPSAFALFGSGAVWMCFAFFFLVTAAFGALQNYAPAVLNHVYGLSLAAAAAGLAAFLLGGAGGILVGGFLANRGEGHDRLIALALLAAAAVALALALGTVPSWSVSLLMGAMGFCAGVAGPSRDLLVRRAATSRFGQGSFGRVYGFVYSGLDIGLAVAPLIFGPLMDAGRFALVLGGVAVFQGLAVLTALGVGRGVKRVPGEESALEG
ncbi:MAG: MFS transporter [Pseudomonadota bacterium]|jgi:predicted MFS family arabinose efflux permease